MTLSPAILSRLSPSSLSAIRRLGGLMVTAFMAAMLVASPALALDLSAADQASLTRIDSYLNSLNSLQADFQQLQPSVNSTDKSSIAEGVLYLARPGRLRVDYTKGASLQIISDGTYLVYRDLAADESSSMRLSDTALSALVKKDVNLARDFKVVGFVRSAAAGAGAGGAANSAAATISVSVMPRAEENRDMLILFFKDSAQNPELLGWSLRNAEGETATLNFRNLQPNAPLKPDLFTVSSKGSKKLSNKGSGGLSNSNGFSAEGAATDRQDQVRTSPVDKQPLKN
ncbi:MAG: LolA family protein [Holosporaceae bacterium]|nr:outer membrane lipoprotein carrier protein LolA [Rhodospirillaceae bacterium]